MESCPKELEPFIEAHNIKIKEIDSLAWSFGHYVCSAVSVAVDQNLRGRQAKSKYLKEPLMKELEEKNKPLSEEELQKQRELFVAKLQVMATNYNLSHPKKDKDKGQ